MRILIDECLDWRLGRAMSGHYCSSVQRMGWAGTTNGQLLRLAEESFDVFLTGDRNLSFQQGAAGLRIAVVVLRAGSTRLHATLPLMPQVAELLPTLRPGDVRFVP